MCPQKLQIFSRFNSLSVNAEMEAPTHIYECFDGGSSTGSGGDLSKRRHGNRRRHLRGRGLRYRRLAATLGLRGDYWSTAQGHLAQAVRDRRVILNDYPGRDGVLPTARAGLRRNFSLVGWRLSARRGL